VTIPGGLNLYDASFAAGASQFRFDGRGIPDESTVDALDNHVYIRNRQNTHMGVSVSLLGLVKVQKSQDGGTTWVDAD
jgi:hypothetical protein